MINSIAINMILLLTPCHQFEPELHLAGNPPCTIKINTAMLQIDLTHERPSSGFNQPDHLASQAWLRQHSMLERVKVKNGKIFFDQAEINIKDTEVTQVWEAFPWKNGIFCYGRTYHRQPNRTKRPLEALLAPKTEDIEPFCAIWINPKTRTGVSRWLYGKNRRDLIIYPIPKS